MSDFIPDSQFVPDEVQKAVQPLTLPPNGYAADSSATAVAQPAEFISDEQFVDDAEKYGTPTEMLKTAAEGIGKGVAGPAFTAAETALLGNEQEQRLRAETNPTLHTATEVGGFIAPAILSAGTSAAARAGVSGAAKIASGVANAAEFSQAGLLEKAGTKALQTLNLGSKETSILGKIGAKSVSEAVQMSLLQAGDEVSKMIQNDPHQTADTVIADIGLAGVLGGTAGAALGAIAPLWKASVGNKAAQLIEDFKGRLKFHSEVPDSTQAVTNELGTLYQGMKETGDEVFGPAGLKAKDIAKAMPQMHPGIPEQAQKIANDLEERIVKMEAKPNSYPDRLVSKAKEDFESYRQTIHNPNATPGEVFNATQDLKQAFQGYAKYDKFVKPVDEAYDFVREAKSLASSLREKLEDSSVWEKAANRQKAINKGFTDYLPTLKDFEKKFTSEVAGERVIDPGKIQTYMNQLGKPNAELKQEMLQNFLKESEKYKQVIHDSHVNLGLESPIQASPLTVTRGTFDESTAGAKLADYFVKKGIYHLAGEAMSASIGGTIGALLGHGVIGTLVGQKALTPFFSSVLPALVKPFQNVTATSAGVKSAIDYGLAAARGETIINKAAKGVFREATDNVIKMLPHEGDRTKLDKALKTAQIDPESLTTVAGDVGHFLPEHAAAIAQVSGRAVQYLNALRPDTAPKAPLDPKVPPNAVQQASYNRALDLANQPLLVLQSIKNGTLTPKDVQTVKTLYPSLYDKLVAKLSDEMISHISKGDTVPYTQRLQLSLFMGQPLDSTMTPAAIMAAQPHSDSDHRVSDPGTPTKPPPASSVKSLGKIAQMSNTPGQTRESARAAGKG